MKTILTDGLRAPKGSLLGWFGRGRDSEADELGHNPAQIQLVRQARRKLLQDIGTLLLDNDLEITTQNLTTAHSAFAGLNPGLKRRIERQLENGRPISQEWLNLATASDSQFEDDSVEMLMAKLDQSLDAFARSTQTVRTATTEYGDALESHVGKLETAANPADLFSDLAVYARAMLERSRKIEADLRHSEEESAALRHNLDCARRDAELDFLTGLPNRRAFEAVLETQVSEAKIAGEALCIALCDIDLFKNINDTHGHEAGDRIICVVGETLTNIAGSTCNVARHGGEEFVMLFRGEKPAEAMHKLDDAREKLANRKLVNRKTEQPFGKVSFSAGIADVFAYDDHRAALAAADEALYQAKEAGRNQIKLAYKPIPSA